jgi:hypothetical protein
MRVTHSEYSFMCWKNFYGQVWKNLLGFKVDEKLNLGTAMKHDW